jgi:hypothetical protein
MYDANYEADHTNRRRAGTSVVALGDEPLAHSLRTPVREGVLTRPSVLTDRSRSRQRNVLVNLSCLESAETVLVADLGIR